MFSVFTKRLSNFYWLILILTLSVIAGCRNSPINPADSINTQPIAGSLLTLATTGKSTFIPPPVFTATLDINQTLTPDPRPISSNTLIKSPAALVPTPTHLAPGEWMSLPVIPTVSQTARQIYQRGIEMGNDPHAFSKIGDCQSITTYFLASFDRPGDYDLGSYTSLQETIDWYIGSFSRESLAVKGGFNAAAILSPLRADQKQCHTSENPISCEFHLHHPSVAIISLEEWWAGQPENYEKYLRQIIEFTISQGVVPILATKADNLEGNNMINETIANLAQEYDIPLWNFWASVQDLPNHGLAAYDPWGNKDMFHLTHGELYEFSDELENGRSGWTMRNLTALQALDAVQRGLTAQP